MGLEPAMWSVETAENELLEFERRVMQSSLSHDELIEVYEARIIALSDARDEAAAGSRAGDDDET